jgi:hypothetical protein
MKYTILIFIRSGDKSSDCNVGLFVRNDDEWDWLRSLLSIAKMKELLGEEYKGGQIDRFEVPNLVCPRLVPCSSHLTQICTECSPFPIEGPP